MRLKAKSLIEGVKLSVDTPPPLKDLKEVCRKLGLSVSGRKNKALRRLRLHYEVLEKQLASEVARKMFAEQERAGSFPNFSSPSESPTGTLHRDAPPPAQAH